jgi:hypothetical protein
MYSWSHFTLKVGPRWDLLVQAALLELLAGAAGAGVVPPDIAIGIEGNVRLIPEGPRILLFSQFLLETPEVLLRIAMP